MKVMVISFIILLSGAIYDPSSFEYPPIVEKDVEFFVKILFESNETYDVKIYVEKDSKNFSEIYSSSWVSSRKYLQSAFPNEKSFKVISHYSGDAEICIKLRNSENFKEIFEKCDKIKVLDSIVEKSNYSLKNDEKILLNSDMQNKKTLFLSAFYKTLIISVIFIISILILLILFLLKRI